MLGKTNISYVYVFYLGIFANILIGILIFEESLYFMSATNF